MPTERNLSRVMITAIIQARCDGDEEFLIWSQLHRSYLGRRGDDSDYTANPGIARVFSWDEAREIGGNDPRRERDAFRNIIIPRRLAVKLFDLEPSRPPVYLH